MLTLAAVFIISVIAQLASAGSWSYDDHHGNGPKTWYRENPDCGGSRQSPIDIDQSVTQMDSSMGEITFQGYDTSAGYSYKASNNGHTVVLNVASGDMTIDGGNLPNGPYRLAQFHVHWGSTNDVGSEHTVNGKFYPLEIHLVHINNHYANISEALKHSDGLAVLGIFAEVGNTRHETLQKFIDSFAKVTNAGSEAAVDAFPMRGLLPTETIKFTRYDGSLTTPKCSEVVTWTVFKNPITITQTQLNAFRTLNHNAAGEPQESLVNNYRPVQPLNKRIVKRSYEVTQVNSGHRPTTAATILFGSALTLAVFLFR